MARAIPRDRRLKRFSGEHLLYEIRMLYEVTPWLFQINDNMLRNAAIEAFGVHLRVVTDFLYKTAQRRDDVCAEDFVSDPTAWRKARRALPSPLRTATRRVDKQLAHLTFQRYRGAAPQKKWNPMRLIALVREPLRVFRAHAIDQRLHKRVRDYIDAL